MLRLVPLTNKVKRPCGFAFYAREVRAAVRAAERAGAEVAGTFHSHPFSGITPGRSDCLNARGNSLMLIIDTFDRRIGLWRISRRKAFRLWFRRVDA